MEGSSKVGLSDCVLRLEISRPASNFLSKFIKSFNFKVKTVSICSLILAAKSPFFHKLFSNGMKESMRSKNGGVTVRIHHSEEAAFTDLLSFIYDKPLKATSEAELFDLLIVADKYEVYSCVSHCSELLLKFPLTTGSAVCYIEHSSSAFLPVIEPLVDEAKKFLAANFRDFTKSKQDAAMELPLSAMEVVLGSDGLKVESEDVVFDFELNWARKHYPNLEERRDIMANRVATLICFHHMSVSKMKQNLGCPDFHQERMSELVVNALSSKLEASNSTTFPSRVYSNRLVKVVHLQLALPRCAVYFDVTKGDCVDLVPQKELYSQTFCLGGESFSLSVKRGHVKDTLGVYVNKEGGSETCTLDVHFSAMNKPSNHFKALGYFVHVFKKDKGWGYPDAFETPWEKLMGDESEYFIDGILHFRADITFIK